MNLVEKIGSGIIRMKEEMNAYELKPPSIEADENWFDIIFYRKIASEGINEGINRLSEYIQNNPGMRVNVIADAIGVPEKTIERWIKKLKDKGLIEYRGSKKTGGYFCNLQ